MVCRMMNEDILQQLSPAQREAVLNYEKHDYLYFCARPEMDGRHNFARTHREHERNAAAYHRALERQNIR